MLDVGPTAIGYLAGNRARVGFSPFGVGILDVPPDNGNGTKLADRAYREIEELIVTLQFQPRTVLSEQSLAEQLEMGRTPIREALQRLAFDGLVEIMPRRGVLVTDINLHTQLRLLEVRRELERLIARLAAERASEKERRTFASLAEGMLLASRKSDDLGFMRLDLQFNQLLAASARNEFASRAMSLLAGQSRRFWYYHYKAAADLPLTAKLHAKVASAIAEGSAERAAQASDQLLDYIGSFARKTLDY